MKYRKGADMIEGLVATFGAMAFIFSVFIMPIILTDGKCVEVVEACIEAMDDVAASTKMKIAGEWDGKSTSEEDRQIDTEDRQV